MGVMHQCGKYTSGGETWITHHLSYKVLQSKWLSENGELVVNKQVLIAFSIGKYKDEVLCVFQLKQLIFY